MAEVSIKAWLDILEERLPRFRAAGVTRLVIDAIEVEMLPLEVTGDDVDDEDDEDEFTDPLEDPSTYPGGSVPGFARVAQRRRGDIDE